jgi:DNA-binding LacI/PurR family transcriptional regulator
LASPDRYDVSMAVSIIELSKVAGVSKSTVSRVLNHDPRVSPSAVTAVRAAVEQLGYTRPQRMGRPRRTPTGIRHNAALLFFPDPNPRALRTVLSARLMHGAEEVFRQKGMSLVVAGMPAAGRVPQIVEQTQVDGVIMRGSPTDAGRRAVTDALARVPTIYVFEPRGTVPPTWDVVLEDNESIGQIAAEYLRRGGGKRFLFVNQLTEHPSLRHRGAAFAEAARVLGAEALVVHSDAPAARIVSGLEGDWAVGRIDGVFAPGSDDVVVELYRALQKAGRDPGGTLPFISCVNDPKLLAALDPRLANIDINPEAIGRAAAESLLWRLQNPKEPQRRLAIAPTLSEAGERAA